MAHKRTVHVRRVHDAPAQTDGTRVLVDRIWPRGMTKEKAHLDEWCKQVAPSTELRKWYIRNPDRFAEFSHRRGLCETKQPHRPPVSPPGSATAPETPESLERWDPIGQAIPSESGRRSSGSNSA